MSHSIFVPDTENASAVLAAIPGLRWCGADARVAHDAGKEVLITCDGGARGVAIVSDEDGTMVRIFTASSRPDVDLAIAAVRALAASTGGGAVNEDDEELDDDDEITERYDAEFREAYVTWGPTALVEQLDEPSSVISLSGPWTNARIDGAELSALRKAHRKDDQFAAAVIARLVAAQDRARPLHAQLDAGDGAAVIANPDGAAALEEWVTQQFGSSGVARVRRVLAGLPDAFITGTQPVLCGALDVVEGLPAGDPFATRVHALAVRAATEAPSFAELIANRALALAQAGSFPAALVLFDVVVELPELDTSVIDVSSGAADEENPESESVPKQSSWMCNATWAAQADNNELPVNAERARRYIERASPYAPANPAIYFNLACLSVELGDHPGALRMISLAQQHGFSGMDDIASEPLLTPLHDSADWAAALAGQL